MAKSNAEVMNQRWTRENTSHSFNRGKVPTFTGEGNVEPAEVKGFIDALDLYFDINHIENDTEKVMYLGTNLAKTARVWYSGKVQRRYNEVAYSDLINQLIGRFMPTRYEDDAWERLEKLRQTGTVAAYTARFAELVDIIDPQYHTGTILVKRYISGLRKDIKRLVRMSNPKSLQEVYEIAHNLEEPQETSRGFRPAYRPFARPSNPEDMDLDAINTNKGRVFNGGRGPRQRPEQQRETRTCFECSQKGHIAAHCPSKTSRQNHLNF